MTTTTRTGRQLGRGAAAAVVLAVLVALAVLLAVAAWAPSRAFAASGAGELAAGAADAAGALDAAGVTGPAGATEAVSTSESASAADAAGFAGSLSVQATKAAKKAKSGKRTVYIVTGEKDRGTIHTSSEDKGTKLTQTRRFTYTKDGLLKKSVLKRSDDKGKTTVKYSYKSKRLARAVTKNTLSSKSLRRSNYVCTYEKGGRVVNAKLKEVYEDGSGGPATHARAVYDKSGRLKKVVEFGNVVSNGVHLDIATGVLSETHDLIPYTYTTTYKYKNRKIVREFDNGTSVQKTVTKLDKRGNEILNDGDNTYDGEGRLTKRTYTTSDFWGWNNQTVKYTYKAIKVPASMVAKIEAQQWAILNRNKNGALGVL